MKSAKKQTNDLQAACRNLRATLLEDLALGRRMLANSEAQREALVANDHRRVSEISAQGQDITAMQTANGFRREAAIRLVALSCGIECADGETLPRMPDLILHLPHSEARSLLALRTSILEAEKKLRDANGLNRTLVQNALDVVQFTFHALTDLALRPSTYGANPNRLISPTFYLDHRA